MSLTESASTLSSEDVSDLPVEDSGILAEYTSDGLEERDVGTDSDASTIVDEPLEVSFVFKSNPTKIKLDCRLLSGFCMESAVPLEEGLNDETFGVVVGKRVGKDILSTHVIIPIERDLEKQINWILHEFKPWGNKTEVVGIIVSHISNSGFGLSSFEAHSLKTLMTGINKLSVAIVAGFSSEKVFLGAECYSLTSIGLDKTKICQLPTPHEACNFDKTFYEPSKHTEFGQFDWDVFILDKRNDTEIENPYNFITELGNMVEPELATEDFELDISNLTNEIHLNEQEFDDVIFNEFDRSWSFSGNLNLTGPDMFSISIPMSESLDELSGQSFARPLTPLNSAIIQPSISPSPAG